MSVQFKFINKLTTVHLLFTSFLFVFVRFV